MDEMVNLDALDLIKYSPDWTIVIDNSLAPAQVLHENDAPLRTMSRPSVTLMVNGEVVAEGTSQVLEGLDRLIEDRTENDLVPTVDSPVRRYCPREG